MLLGKAAHYSLLLVVPVMLHGWTTALIGAAAYRYVGCGVCLFVSARVHSSRVFGLPVGVDTSLLSHP